MPETPLDTPAQRKADRRRVLRAFNASLASVLLLAMAFAAQSTFDWRPLAIAPHTAAGLLGILTAPLLHGSFEHLLMNAIALLMLGTLSGLLYPRATLRAIPLLWLGSGVGAWLWGATGTHHLGASGIGHGLMFLLLTLGLLRRDRPAIAAAMIAVLFYGGMLLTVLPREVDVSWQAHLGGALAGILAGVLWRKADPRAPRRQYSWELEDDASLHDANSATLEPPRPVDVPALWQRDTSADAPGVVLRFRRNDIPRQ